jgi:hypothetical protein
VDLGSLARLWRGNLVDSSVFLATGGRVGDSVFRKMLLGVAERDHQRADAAPSALGDLIAYQYVATSENAGWLRYLAREALGCDAGKVPYEESRAALLQGTVDAIRGRQERGIIQSELDPALLSLLVTALASYPQLHPQITRMTVGIGVHEPEFTRRWTRFLQAVFIRVESDR